MSDTFGSWFGTKRRFAKVRLRTVAEIAGVSISLVSATERGVKKPPSINNLPNWLKSIGAEDEFELAKKLIESSLNPFRFTIGDNQEYKTLLRLDIPRDRIPALIRTLADVLESRNPQPIALFGELVEETE